MIQASVQPPKHDKMNKPWGLFHKTSLPNKPGLFQLVWLILNQINWQYVRLTEINLAYLVNLIYETGSRSICLFIYRYI